jgi:acyl-CoA synthetase (NDP forming)
MARDHGALYVHGQPGVKALGHAIAHGTARVARLRAAQVRLAARRKGETSFAERAELLRRLGPAPSESDVKELLAGYGLPAPSERVASTAEEAVEAAREIGFPVVLKISSPDVVHKTDAGGVLLDLRDEDAVRHGFDRVMTSVAGHLPEARLTGVVVSQYISQGVEVLLGVVVDPSLGPVVVVGAGGIYVEQFGDATCALPPFDAEVAESMLRRLRIWKVLEGARGGERADVDSLAAAVARFSQLVSDVAGSLVSLEINPLVVRPGAGGVLALDAVMELAGEGVTA